MNYLHIKKECQRQIQAGSCLFTITELALYSELSSVSKRRNIPFPTTDVLSLEFNRKNKVISKID